MPNNFGNKFLVNCFVIFVAMYSHLQLYLYLSNIVKYLVNSCTLNLSLILLCNVTLKVLSAPLSWWKEFVDGHLMSQGEFHIFDGGLFEDLQLTLVTIL